MHIDGMLVQSCGTMGVGVMKSKIKSTKGIMGFYARVMSVKKIVVGFISGTPFHKGPVWKPVQL